VLGVKDSVGMTTMQQQQRRGGGQYSIVLD